MHQAILIMLIIIILLVSSVLLIIKSYKNYNAWKEHRNYLKQNPEIQPWMSIKLISKEFNLSEQEIFQRININESKINSHISLNNLCKKYNKNCAELIAEISP